MKSKKRIVIVDCCGERFSKIIEEWHGEEPVVGEEKNISLSSDQLWDVHIKNILPANSSGNPYEFDVIFTTSEDEDLFLCLCEYIREEKGWFEKEEACSELS